MLTRKERIIQICQEETISEIKNRYMELFGMSTMAVIKKEQVLKILVMGLKIEPFTQYFFMFVNGLAFKPWHHKNWFLKLYQFSISLLRPYAGLGLSGYSLFSCLTWFGISLDLYLLSSVYFNML